MRRTTTISTTMISTPTPKRSTSRPSSGSCAGSPTCRSPGSSTDDVGRIVEAHIIATTEQAPQADRARRAVGRARVVRARARPPGRLGRAARRRRPLGAGRRQRRLPAVDRVDHGGGRTGCASLVRVTLGDDRGRRSATHRRLGRHHRRATASSPTRRSTRCAGSTPRPSASTSSTRRSCGSARTTSRSSRSCSSPRRRNRSCRDRRSCARNQEADAVARAVLDATNRRLAPPRLRLRRPRPAAEHAPMGPWRPLQRRVVPARR